MVNKITVERECEHKIIVKEGLVLLVTATEFFHKIEDFDNSTKYAVTNVSVISEDNGTAILSKISGSGKSLKEAYSSCVNNFNYSIEQYKDENQILLCSPKIPPIMVADLQDFQLTRLIKFSWTKEKKSYLLTVYVLKEEAGFKYIYDGNGEIFHAKSDKEIIEHIFSCCNFDDQPKQVNNKLRDKLFYPTTKEFQR